MIKSIDRRRLMILCAIAASLTAGAFFIAWVGNDFVSSANWLSYWVMLLCGLILFWAAWRIIAKDQPPLWLAWVTFAAVLLRLGLACLWLHILPVAGYGSNVEKAGYVMKDAYTRDSGAWKLAKSDKPLSAAFTQDITGDQYGGLMFLSAMVYRFSGAKFHHPLLLVVLTSFFSSLAVLFSWAFSRRVWGTTAAAWAAWIVAFYPEAVLLGSSQMREPFVVTFSALGFYGLVLYYQESRRFGSIWLLIAITGAALFSPPLTGLLFVSLLGLAMVFESSNRTLKNLINRRGFWISLVVVLLLVTAVIWLTWAQIVPRDVRRVFDLMSWWARRATLYQSYLSQTASGWLQREFNKLPGFLHIPVLVLYGMVRPFLPATLVAYRLPLWYGISIWRSLGWAFMLPSLFYATLLASSAKREDRADLTKAICIIAWIGIFIASIRGGGDDWDNARYRLLFLTLQAGLTGWAWARTSWRSSPGLRRAFISAVIFFLWFMPWYIRRYHGMEWNVISIFHTLGLALASVVLFLLWDWARVG